MALARWEQSHKWEDKSEDDFIHSVILTAACVLFIQDDLLSNARYRKTLRMLSKRTPLQVKRRVNKRVACALELGV